MELGSKECTKCNVIKNLYEFAKSKKSYKSRCKECDKKYLADYYKRNSEKLKSKAKKYLQDNPEWKKNYDKTYRKEHEESIKEYKKQYTKKFAEELKRKRKSHYENNKDSILAKQKNYVFRNREQVLKRKSEYYLKNKVVLNEKKRDYYYRNRDYFISKSNEWRVNNLEKSNAIKRNYKARKVKLLNDFTLTQQKLVLKLFNGGCVITGSKDIHWDHVIPLAVGHGGTTYGNMIPLRSDLNCSKQDSNIFEWFEANRQRFELSQERFDKLIGWLASANAMTVEEYRDYVYWCHDNPRTIDEINEENESEAI